MLAGEKSMRAKVLLAVFVLMAGLSQAFAVQDSQSKGGYYKPSSNAPTDNQSADNRIEKPVAHEFVIANFKTESGVVLPQARIEYGTYGHLNAARDNAVLLPSHYMADLHGYEWLSGPGHALDTSQLFLITSELFGNGHSSSPSNTPEPFHGPRFPEMTVRDNVEAVHRLLT